MIQQPKSYKHKKIIYGKQMKVTLTSIGKLQGNLRD